MNFRPDGAWAGLAAGMAAQPEGDFWGNFWVVVGKVWMDPWGLGGAGFLASSFWMSWRDIFSVDFVILAQGLPEVWTAGGSAGLVTLGPRPFPVDFSGITLTDQTSSNEGLLAAAD